MGDGLTPAQEEAIVTRLAGCWLSIEVGWDVAYHQGEWRGVTALVELLHGRAAADRVMDAARARAGVTS